MIPKKIHYCWFGGNPLPELAQKCIASWKKYCPDYEIIEWNESNFDFTSCDYAREAYEAKKWAFVTDYARLEIIFENGGIYLDTDVELLSSLDAFLENDCFMGIEKGNYIATGLGFGAIPHFEIINELINEYKHMSFLNPDGSYNLTTCPIITTQLFIKKGFIQKDFNQIIDDTFIYSSEYFCPKNFETGIVNITDKTIAIHHFDGSWLSEEEKYINSLYRKYSQRFSNKTAHRLSLIVGYRKYRGLLKMPIEIIKLKLGNKYNNEQI